MSGYEYGNTRLRAMRARLLTAVDLGPMVAAVSLDRMLALLADTAYGPDVEASLVRARGLRRLDEAVRSNLARTLRQMASFYREEPRELVDLLLRRWDLQNLRALVRSVPTPLEPGELSRLLVPAGRLTETELAELADQPDVRSRVDLMVAWHIPSATTAIDLLRARARFEAEGDHSALEMALDDAFGEEMDEVLGDRRTGAVMILRAERDARNLGVALRLRAARLDEESGWSEGGGGYVSGGSIPARVWEEVAETDQPETVVEVVTARRLLPGWAEALEDWVEDGRLGLLEDRVRRATAAAAVARVVTGDVLDFDVPVAFTFAKEAEARNLHLIGRGIVHGIPRGEIEERLEAAA